MTTTPLQDLVLTFMLGGCVLGSYWIARRARSRWSGGPRIAFVLKTALASFALGLLPSFLVLFAVNPVVYSLTGTYIYHLEGLDQLDALRRCLFAAPVLVALPAAWLWLDRHAGILQRKR